MTSTKNIHFTKEHEWIQESGEHFSVGISDYAQTELGDVVFVDLPAVGKVLRRGESLCTVESTKAVSDVYAPVDGTVVEVNEQLASAPELINNSPDTEGWIAKIQVAVPQQIAELMDATQYAAYVSEISK